MQYHTKCFLNVATGLIWLIGGTSESKSIAQALWDEGIAFFVTVTTPEARSLYPKGSQVLVTQRDRQGIESLLQEHRVRGIVDASHPFAQVISQEAMAAAAELHVPYLRFERSQVEQESITFPNFADLLEKGAAYLLDRRVLLTVGCRSLPLFHGWHDRSCLFARILPSPTSLATALQAGFLPQRLVAMRPPFSLEWEVALFKHWQIETVVTKASGEAGGEVTKSQACAQLQIPLLVIDRPALSYPAITDRVSEVLSYCAAIVSA